jgi:transposase-like protein
MQIDYHGLLFAAIALQLALVIADADSLYSCSGCGMPYIRPREKRRPKPGWANYCTRCSDGGVAQRKAAESYRGKRAKAVQMHSSGVSLQEIAETLKTEASRVNGWLKNERMHNAKAKKTREQ